MSEIVTTATCNNCGYEWTESLFDYITPNDVRKVFNELADYFENLKCPNCGSGDIVIGGSASWD